MILHLALPVLFGFWGNIAPVHIDTDKVYHSEHPPEVACSCVSFVRQYRPDAPLIDAYRHTVSTTTPSPRSVAVMRYPSGVSHVAFVVSVTDTHVELLHANVVPCEVTTEMMERSNPRLLGYY